MATAKKDPKISLYCNKTEHIRWKRIIADIKFRGIQVKGPMARFILDVLEADKESGYTELKKHI